MPQKVAEGVLELRNKDVKRREKVAAEEPRKAGRDEIHPIGGDEWGHFGDGAEVAPIERMFGLNEVPCEFDQSLDVGLSPQCFVSDDEMIQGEIGIAFVTQESRGLREDLAVFVDLGRGHDA